MSKINPVEQLKELMQVPSLLIRRTGNELFAVYIDKPMIPDSSLYVLHSTGLDLHYILGVLNSRLMKFYFRKRNLRHVQTHPHILMSQLNRIPVKSIDSFEEDKLNHDKIVKFVKILIALKEQKHTMETDDEVKILKRQIDETEQQINLIIYQIYQLTEEEIEIIEAHDE